MENYYESLNEEKEQMKKVNNYSRSKNDEEEKEMYFNENEIKDKLRYEKADDNNDDINRMVTGRKSFITNFTSDKKFDIDLTETKYKRLKSILPRDINFLHSIGIFRPKFFVVKKSINEQPLNNILNKSNNEIQNYDDDENEKIIILLSEIINLF